MTVDSDGLLRHSGRSLYLDTCAATNLAQRGFHPESPTPIDSATGYPACGASAATLYSDALSPPSNGVAMASGSIGIGESLTSQR
jgi:hypothetical protein